MTENITTHAPAPYPDHMQPAPKKPKAWWQKPLVLLPIVALVLGLGIGAAATPEPKTITKEVPGPERIVDREVEVPKTPTACLTALDLSEQVIGYAGEALGYTQAAMVAASELDAAGIRAQTSKVSKLAPKITALSDPLKAAKAECRAAE